MTTVANIMPLNRAEELGRDLWDSFVIPPYYDILNLKSVKKPIIIVGGRGCGKTMLLRYLCHETQFSQNRDGIDIDDLHNIGIYWRIDTQFGKILRRQGQNEDVWERAFEHMAVLLTSIEILKSLETIASSCFQYFNQNDISDLDFNLLDSFNSNIPHEFNSLKVYLRKEFNRFQSWAGSPTVLDQPAFLPKSFLIELITEIKSQKNIFKQTNYLVYIDEYENLLEEQKILINTWLKHSEMPLIFNVAMKRNSFQERRTVGAESLSHIHDYREHDLESFYDDSIKFDVFAAEILLLRLNKTGQDSMPINIDDLRKPDKSYLLRRRSSEYRKDIISYAKTLFPTVSTEQTARDVFQDETLKDRLEELITSGLRKRKSSYKVEDFLFADYPEASIVSFALLHRAGNLIQDIVEEFQKLRNKEYNKFSSSTGWIHNNIIGCLLLIYDPLGRVCPVYTGFEAFCRMSKTNLRHFLELCNKSIVNENLYNDEEITQLKAISPKHQSEAAKQASVGFLKEIKSFGEKGTLLHSFAMRIGTYFRYAQKRPSQSEPEQNHFIVTGTVADDVRELLEEAVKWSVLYESRSTKQKDHGQGEFNEYVLNPIYSPYFHISYRKKRKVEFSQHEILIFMNGSVPAYEDLMKKYLKKWALSASNEQSLSLFAPDQP